MFVRQLIGRQAGEIIEMRADAAQACLAQGSAAPVTDEEMAAAGIAKPPPAADTVPTLPEGYEALARPDGLGFDVYRTPVMRGEKGAITSESLNPAPLPNMIAVRDFIAAIATPNTPPSTQDAGNVAIPEDWQSLSATDLKALAKALGADPAPSTKADASAFIEKAITDRATAAVSGSAPSDPDAGADQPKG